MDKTGMLESLINYYTDGNKAKFATMIGVKPQTVSAWLSRNTFDAETIYANCEGVSSDWLLNGEGEMLKHDNSALPVDESQGIPYYDIEVFECGTPAGFGGALEASNPDGYFNFPWIKNDGSTFCVRAHGNSMLNTADPVHSICHGSYIALRKSQMGAIQWGEVYALATCDGCIIKKLMPSEKENCVKCVSFNAEEYPAFDLQASDIYEYAKVVGVATINLW